MIRYNLWLFLATTLAAGTACAGGSDPIAPNIDQQDQRFLAIAARRTYDQYVKDRTIYTSRYVPPALKGIDCEVVVTLRRNRLLLGVGSAGPGPIVRTTIEAAIAAIRSDENNTDLATRHTDDLLIEIEAIGPQVALDIGDRWLEPATVDRIFEPGVDGFSVSCGNFSKRVCPSELATKNLLASDAIKSVIERLPGPRGTQTLSRFRSTHWYQPRTGDDVVALRRGLVLVAPDTVTAKTVNSAITSLADYSLYRQLPSGAFAYEYEPAADTYTKIDDPVHQAGAAWALTVAANFAKSESLAVAADRALEFHRARILSIPDTGGAAFVASVDRRNKLGLTAQIALAMSAHSNRSRYETDRKRLVLGMLWLQKPSGEFITAFPPARRLTGTDRYPGMALLALLAEYEDRPDQRIQDPFNLARDFYQSEFERRPTVGAAMWLAQPFARMAVITNRKEYARFAFTLADRLADHQLSPANCPWPELHGGVLPKTATAPNIETAVCLAAWTDAMAAAQKFGDTQRAARYETAARNASRFVLQLQVKEAETYHMRVVTDALGGVRTSVADNRLRIENVQYALIGLTAFHRALLSPSHSENGT